MNTLTQSLTTPGLEILPVGKKSASIYARKNHVFIGASPFNSYFSIENLVILIRWALDNFEHMHIFVPDNISVFTLMAKGYTEEKALQKTRRQDSYLRNKVFRAFNEAGISDLDAAKMFIPLSELYENPYYKRLYEECLVRFDTDPEFRNNCLSTCSWVLNNKEGDSSFTGKAYDLAVQYFLREFPLFQDVPHILGVNSSLFVYHSIPPYLNELYLNSAMISSDQGFLVVKIP